jgi:hypothetical protein
MTLNEFYKMLAGHDWYYQYSDDHGVWRRGQDRYDTIAMVAKESPEHQKLFEDYSDYIFRSSEKPPAPDA